MELKSIDILIIITPPFLSLTHLIATVSVVTTPLETWSSRPLNLPLWAPPLKLQALSQSPVLALQTFFSPIGPTAVQPLSTSTSSLLSSPALCQKLRRLRDTLYKWESSASWLPTFSTAAMQVCHVSLLSLKLLEVWPRISFLPFKLSADQFVSDQVPTEIRTTQRNTFQQSQLGFVAGQCLYADS